ncbi:MAG: hypothetical protein L0Y55_12940 [Anaerolineales bacterium]|nr:hypothetical protein [Anaerolineales bacterium]
MSNTADTSNAHARENKPMKLWLRLLIAIPMAAIFVWIGYTICMPLAFVAGMLSDSCDRLYVLWEIWILVLWTGILLVSALAPAILIALGRRWRWVLLSMVVGVGVSVTWYILWYVIAMVVCSV